MNMNFNTEQLRSMFLKMEEQERDVIVTKKAYVDLTGDLVAGILLSQILYWNKPTKKGEDTKLRVKKKDKETGETHLWLAKGRNDWYDEIRISPKQFDRASKILVDQKLIEKKTFKFNGDPTVHIRVIWENFLPKYMEVTGLFNEYENEEEPEEQPEDEGKPLEPHGFSPKGKNEITQRVKTELPKGEERNYPKVNNDIDQRGISLTESTSEITSEIIYKDYIHKSSSSSLSETTENSKKEKNKRNDDDEIINIIENNYEYEKLMRYMETNNLFATKKEMIDVIRYLVDNQLQEFTIINVMQAHQKLKEQISSGTKITKKSSYFGKLIIDSVGTQNIRKEISQEQEYLERKRQQQRSERRVPFYNWLEERE